MQEIFENGPIVVSFEPSYAFMSYDSGIYAENTEAIYLTEGSARPEWTKVDHSVLLYGWGEEDGV